MNFTSVSSNNIKDRSSGMINLVTIEPIIIAEVSHDIRETSQCISCYKRFPNYSTSTISKKRDQYPHRLSFEVCIPCKFCQDRMNGRFSRRRSVKYHYQFFVLLHLIILFGFSPVGCALLHPNRRLFYTRGISLNQNIHKRCISALNFSQEGYEEKENEQSHDYSDSSAKGQRKNSRESNNKKNDSSLLPPILPDTQKLNVRGDGAIDKGDLGPKKSASSLLPPRGRKVLDGTDLSESDSFLFPWSSNSLLDINDSGLPSRTRGDSASAPSQFTSALNTSALSEDVSVELMSSPTSSILEGVLPVSELFYRSTQSLDSTDDDDDSKVETSKTPIYTEASGATLFSHVPDSKNYKNTDSLYGDDEELPFSAEQSNKLTTRGVNKINIRRNEAASQKYNAELFDDDEEASELDEEYDNVGGLAGNDYQSGRSNKKKRRSKNDSSASLSKQSTNKSPLKTRGFGGRKMVRRGMEMLVGGDPINADPPLRSIEIRYDASSPEWSGVITTSSRDFGPLLHTNSSPLVTQVSKGLFCENFAHSTLRWKICPKELRNIIQEYDLNAESIKKRKNNSLYNDLLDKVMYLPTEEMSMNSNIPVQELQETNTGKRTIQNKKSPDSDRTSEGPKGFGKIRKSRVKRMSKSALRCPKNRIEVGPFEFILDISKDDLQSGRGGDGSVFRRILAKGIGKAINAKEIGYDVRIKTFEMSEEDTGSTCVSVEFVIFPEINCRLKTLNRETDRIKRVLYQEGEEEEDLAMGVAAAVREESDWSELLKNRVIEELLLEGNADDVIIEEDGKKSSRKSKIFRDQKGSVELGSQVAFPENFNSDAVISEGELKFSMDLRKGDLQSDQYGGIEILQRVLTKGIDIAVRPLELGFTIPITNLTLREIDPSATEVSVCFSFIPIADASYELIDLQREVNLLNRALSQAVDSGELCRSMAICARNEMSWPVALRKKVSRELMIEADLEEDEEENDEEDDEEKTPTADSDESDELAQVNSSNNVLVLPDETSGILIAPDISEGPFVPGTDEFDAGDLFLNGGNGGVFHDYSEQNINNSPYLGNLGPLLVDFAVERAKQRQPRVIAIGDVHGCLDELQALLRRCDYRPGDLVVFLGDLVSKGPDSLSVVQMAREIGSIGVRGNHDFEVIRWHQAIMSGADPPVIGSEHFHIASCLSKADLKWMYSLPWYISSKDLGALFVHAGFVSGIRLTKQNPRLMMNMRSILPDGTVTSKFFNNWPWARLWDGPQTVLFGHDADRGLQQYEHAIGLDTGCVYGGRLTACILPEKRLVSVSAKREYFQYRRKHFD